MIAKMRTMNEVRETGITALSGALGPVDTLRFLRQFDLGRGDYSRDRHRWLGNPTVADLTAQIQKAKPRKASRK
jgi:hypothetical protein